MPRDAERDASAKPARTGRAAQQESRRAAGARYESAAAQFLKREGYEILEKNYYAKRGEIDLIAREGETLCFIEVKYRADTTYGYPAEAIGTRKQAHMIHAAEQWLFEKGFSEANMPPVRFDAVEILGQKIRVLRAAFSKTPGHQRMRRRFP